MAFREKEEAYREKNGHEKTVKREINRAQSREV